MNLALSDFDLAINIRPTENPLNLWDYCPVLLSAMSTTPHPERWDIPNRFDKGSRSRWYVYPFTCAYFIYSLYIICRSPAQTLDGRTVSFSTHKLYRNTSGFPHSMSSTLAHGCPHRPSQSLLRPRLQPAPSVGRPSTCGWAYRGLYC